MKECTKKRKNKLNVLKKRAQNLNKILSKTFVVSREVGEISKCVRSILPKNQQAKMLVDLIVGMKKDTDTIKKSIRSNGFVINNIENINNHNLLKILTIRNKKHDK